MLATASCQVQDSIYCQGETFQRWGKVDKPVRDNQYRRVQVYRYRCCHCRCTLRYYPEGVGRADQTERLRKLVALCWVLGLDGVYPLGWGKKRPVLIAVDLGNGVPVANGQVDKRNPQAVRRFLAPLVQRLGVSVVVTDDLASFRPVARKLGLEQQVCQFHVRRWVSNAMRELQAILSQEWQWVLEEIRRLLAELPPDGSRRLFELWKQIPERRTGQAGARSPVDQLRDLLIRLNEHRESYRIFDWQPDVPWTNNATEQVIGRMKDLS